MLLITPPPPWAIDAPGQMSPLAVPPHMAPTPHINDFNHHPTHPARHTFFLEMRGCDVLSLLIEGLTTEIWPFFRFLNHCLTGGSPVEVWLLVQLIAGVSRWGDVTVWEVGGGGKGVPCFVVWQGWGWGHALAPLSGSRTLLFTASSSSIMAGAGFNFTVTDGSATVSGFLAVLPNTAPPRRRGGSLPVGAGSKTGRIVSAPLTHVGPQQVAGK